MKYCPLLLLTLLLGITAPAIAAHRVILQGDQQLAIVEADGTISWTMPWGGIHDIHMLSNGHVMLQQTMTRVVELDLQTKSAVWSYDASAQPRDYDGKIEIHAFQPLGDGSVMIAESGPARIIEVARDGTVINEFPLVVEHPHAHTDTRLARKLPDGHYLVCHEADGAVREYDSNGHVTWEYKVPLFGGKEKPGHGPEAYGARCFAAVRLPSGNTLISTGNGHGVIEVTPEKKVVWRIKQNDLMDITLAWVTTLEVLPNGHYVIGNCHAGPGSPLLIELDPKTKQVVWTLDMFDTFGNAVSNSQLLDVKNAIR